MVHKEKTKPAKVLSITFKANTTTGTIILTPSHYVFVKSPSAGFERMMSQDVSLGDQFFLPESQEYAEITHITPMLIPAHDLVAVYTPSNTLIANGLYASC